MQLFERLPRRTDLRDFISRTHSTSPKWPILCRMGHKTLTQSISPSVTHIQLWQVILQSVQGFWYRIRSKITFSYWLQVSPLTQWWGTALPVIVSVVDTSVHWITIWSRFLLRIQLLTVCCLWLCVQSNLSIIVFIVSNMQSSSFTMVAPEALLAVLWQQRVASVYSQPRDSNHINYAQFMLDGTVIVGNISQHFHCFVMAYNIINKNICNIHRCL